MLPANRSILTLGTSLALLSAAACSSSPEATESSRSALDFSAPAQGIDSTGWNILTSVNSKKVLDLPAWTTADGAAMEQWSANGGTNQQWKVSLVVPPNQYQFYSTVSGKALGIEAGSTDDRARLIQTGPPAPNQLFFAWDAGNGAVTFQNVASGKCLDVEGASRENGAPIIQYTCNGHANQQWTLTHVFGD